MQFKRKEKPKVGTIKKVTLFAFFPVFLSDKIIWLERYERVLRYSNRLSWEFLRNQERTQSTNNKLKGVHVYEEEEYKKIR